MMASLLGSKVEEKQHEPEKPIDREKVTTDDQMNASVVPNQSSILLASVMHACTDRMQFFSIEVNC